jgi:hypothetical protein
MEEQFMAFDLSLLGVKENIPRVNFMEYTGLIQAPPKWGKTTMASMYPNSILCAVEQGFKAKRINYVDTDTFSKFVAFIDKLELNRKAIGKSIQTIAIDTVDRLYPACQDYMVNKYNNSPKTKYKVHSIGDIPHGKGWGMADDEFLKQINRILEMQFTILFLTHNKIKTVTPEDGEPYDVYVPTMPQRCADLIFPLVDFIINGEKTVEVINGKKVNKRLMRLQGNNMSDSGNRIGNLDAVIKFDTEQEALDKFKEAFKKGIETNIRDSGISKPIDEIEKEQSKEREKELDGYLNKVNESNSFKEEKPKEFKDLSIDDKKTELLKLAKEKAKSHRKEVAEILSGAKVKGNNPMNIADDDTANSVYESFNKIN